MSTGSRFLDEFIMRQGTLIGVEPAKVKGSKQPVHKPKKGRPEGDGDFSAKEEFDKLVQEKPPKKDVLEYFKKRIEQLVQEDMAKV